MIYLDLHKLHIRCFLINTSYTSCNTDTLEDVPADRPADQGVSYGGACTAGCRVLVGLWVRPSGPPSEAVQSRLQPGQQGRSQGQGVSTQRL